VRAADIDQQAARLVAELFRVVRDLVRGELNRGADADPDPWIAHTGWTFCSSKRQACELARSGAIDGVRRLDNREKAITKGGRGVVWIARWSAIERYVERNAKPSDELPRDGTTASEAVAGIAGVLAELGLVETGAKDTGLRTRGGR
jgi:hypothetical protein